MWQGNDTGRIREEDVPSVGSPTNGSAVFLRVEPEKTTGSGFVALFLQKHHTVESCWVVRCPPERSERRGALHLNIPYSLRPVSFYFFQLGRKKNVAVNW